MITFFLVRMNERTRRQRHFDFGDGRDPRYGPVALPRGTLAPTNAQACVHLQDAFFATLLPTSVPGRVSDIWRGCECRKGICLDCKLFVN